MHVYNAAGMSEPEDDEEWDSWEEVDLQARIQDQPPLEDPSYTLRRFIDEATEDAGV